MASCWAVSCNCFVSLASLSIFVWGIANPVARERRLHSSFALESCGVSRAISDDGGSESKIRAISDGGSGILDRSVCHRLGV